MNLIYFLYYYMDLQRILDHSCKFEGIEPITTKYPIYNTDHYEPSYILNGKVNKLCAFLHDGKFIDSMYPALYVTHEISNSVYIFYNSSIINSNNFPNVISYCKNKITEHTGATNLTYPGIKSCSKNTYTTHLSMYEFIKRHMVCDNRDLFHFAD